MFNQLFCFSPLRPAEKWKNRKTEKNGRNKKKNKKNKRKRHKKEKKENIQVNMKIIIVLIIFSVKLFRLLI